MASGSKGSKKWSRRFLNIAENDANPDAESISDTDLSNRLQEILNDSLYANLEEPDDDYEIERMLKKFKKDPSDTSSVFSLGSLKSADVFGSETSSLNNDVFDALPKSSSSVKSNFEQNFTERALRNLPYEFLSTTDKVKNWFSEATDFQENDDQMYSLNSTPPGNDNEYGNDVADSPNRSTGSDAPPLDVAGDFSNSSSPKPEMKPEPRPNLDPDVSEVGADDESIDMTVISFGSLNVQVQYCDVEMIATMTRTEYGQILDSYLKSQEGKK